MANMIGRLGVVLGLDSAEFVMGIDRAGKKLEQFAAKADEYGKYAATAFTVLSIAAIKYADDIADVAEANNVAIDTVVKLRSALESSGGEADKAGVMLASFAKFIDNAASGSFEAQKAFKAVNVSLKDIGSMTQEQLLSKVLSGLAEMDDAVTRTAKSTEFFSKAAKGVAFDKFAQEMSNTTSATKEQIEAVKAGAETWGNLEDIFRKLQLIIVQALGPSLRALNAEMSNATYPKLEMIGKGANFVASQFYNIGAAIDSVMVLLKSFATYAAIIQTSPMNNETVEKLRQLTADRNKELENIKRQQIEFDRILNGGRVGARTDVYPKVGRPSFAGGELRETTVGVDSKQQAALAKMAKEIKDRQEYHNKLIDENIKKNQELYDKEWDALTKKTQKLEDIQKLQDAAYMAISRQQSLRSAQLDYDREILLLNTQNKDLHSYELKYAQEILSIRAMFLQNEKNINENDQLSAVYKKQRIEEEIVLRDKSIAQAREVLDIARQESEGSFQKGFGKGFDEFVRNMPNQLELGRQTFNTLMSSMESALQNFVRTGKFSFKDFARSLIQDMIMIQARANMMSIMKSFWSALGGGTPSVDLGYGGGSAGAVGISGFADGGSPPVGMASLVGERGPELFVPRTAGTIIPNNQLASAMGGGQTVNYNGPYIANMSAIDTQSGAQFLAKNKQAVWATYQSANRSIPVTR